MNEFLLPHEQDLIDKGTPLVHLVVNYRTLFQTCWDVMTPEQQATVDAILKQAGLVKSEKELTDG